MDLIFSPSAAAFIFLIFSASPVWAAPDAAMRDWLETQKAVGYADAPEYKEIQKRICSLGPAGHDELLALAQHSFDIDLQTVEHRDALACGKAWEDVARAVEDRIALVTPAAGEETRKTEVLLGEALDPAAQARFRRIEERQATAYDRTLRRIPALAALLALLGSGLIWSERLEAFGFSSRRPLRLGAAIGAGAAPFVFLLSLQLGVPLVLWGLPLLLAFTAACCAAYAVLFIAVAYAKKAAQSRNRRA